MRVFTLSFPLSRYHLTKVALERKESLMSELEEEREKLIAKVGAETHAQFHYIPLVRHHWTCDCPSSLASPTPHAEYIHTCTLNQLKQVVRALWDSNDLVPVLLACSWIV